MTDFDKFFGANYDLVDTLKSDGKNFVAVAYDKISKRLCVIKERDIRSRKLYEILRELDSAHVPKIYRLLERDGKLVAVEEHIDGQTLDEILTYRPEILTEKFVADIFMQTCEALVALHEAEIIHRDLTPSNIMITVDNTVKLVDFDIARIFKPESSTDTEFLGTRGYAAPEQFGVFDLGQTDARTDIFVLGTTVKRLLGSDYGGRLAKVLNRCTDLNPASRYQSVAEVIHAVKRADTVHKLKRLTAGVAIFGVIFFVTQTVDFTDEKVAEPEIADEVVADVPIAEPQKVPDEIPQTSPLSTNVTDGLIDFVNGANDAQTFEMPDVQIQPLPTRHEFKLEPEVAEPVTETAAENPRRSRLADRVKLYLYFNGKLTENNGEHTLMGTVTFDNDKIFTRNSDGDLLFPTNWKARLKIENFTAKDLINPTITVTFGKEKIFIDRPTVKKNQTVEVDIPLAGKVAFRAGSKSTRLAIAVKSPGDENSFMLIRNLKLQ